MKIRIPKTIGFNEVDAQRQLRLKHLFNYLQEAAAIHSLQVGCGTGDLLEQGYAWVLNKVGLTINRLPRLEETIEIVTWHKGTRGFRSYRDYQIKSGDEVLVSATSLWLFIDVDKKKIIKPPADLSARYTFESDDATDLDLDSWRPVKDFEPEYTVSVATRPSDFDPLGHVNNAVYLDYLEVLQCKYFNIRITLSQLLIQYLKETPSDLRSITAALFRHEGQISFNLKSKKSDHAVGCFNYLEEFPCSESCL
ncbi:MAG: thioesterase [Desulfosarcinaceae bacterium]|nr:thioesterase [Desulfosarcinaceae bacterium]